MCFSRFGDRTPSRELLRLADRGPAFILFPFECNKDLITIFPFLYLIFPPYSSAHSKITLNTSSICTQQSKPTAIGVLGGSVSSCHGLDATTAHPLGNPIGPNCYPHRVFAWLNDVFPHPANELTNGAREFPHTRFQ